MQILQANQGGYLQVQIEYIREFILLAENMSFVDTAKQLYTTTSTLSRHIASIEEEIDAQLLIRDKHHVRLTQEGRIFLKGTEDIVDNYDHTLLEIQSLKRSNTFTISIGYLHDATYKYVAKLRHALDKAEGNFFPKYFALEYGALSERLSKKKIDIALTLDLDKTDADRFDKINLAADKYTAVVPKGHTLAKKEMVSLEELAEFPLIFPDEKAMSGTVPIFKRAFESVNTHYTVASCYEDLPSLFCQVQTGEGVSLSLSHHVPWYENDVKFIPLKNDLGTFHICLMWLKDNSKITPKLIEQLKQLAKEVEGM